MSLVTPELLGWVDSQRKAGFDDPALLDALVKAGYERGFSESLLAGNLTVSSAGQTAQALAGGAIETHSVSKTIGEPLFEPDPSGFFRRGLPASASLTTFNINNCISVRGAAVRILAQMVRPRVTVFEGILSPAECDELIDLAKPRLDVSKTVDRVSGDSVQHQARVSSGMFFQRGENPLVSLLEERMSALLGFPVENGEGLQILNYKPGGKYDPHQDYFDPAESGSQVHTKRGGQRVATMIVYLNTPDAGGGTVFPESGLTISAVKGNALFFSYPDAVPESLCLHGGNPVISGEKWIATKWIRTGRFV
jgi:prolyl 4-hydroxylase